MRTVDLINSANRAVARRTARTAVSALSAWSVILSTFEGSADLIASDPSLFIQTDHGEAYNSEESP